MKSHLEIFWFFAKNAENTISENGGFNLDGNLSNGVDKHNGHTSENVGLEKNQIKNPIDKLSENSSIEKEETSEKTETKPMDDEPLLNDVKVWNNKFFRNFFSLCNSYCSLVFLNYYLLI